MREFYKATIKDGEIYLDGMLLFGVTGYALKLKGGPLKANMPILEVRLLLSGAEITGDQIGNNVSGD